MADFTYQGAPAAPVSARMASAANWAGAAMSLALVVGISVWGYRVVARDVSGVPIVEAMSGPMRVAPDDPGGTLADHQGLAVNAVAGKGAAAAPPDRVVLSPRAAGLQEDDLAFGALAPVDQTAEFQPSLAANAAVVEIEPSADAAELRDNALASLADEIAANAKPLSPLTPQVSDTNDEVVAALAAALPKTDAPEEEVMPAVYKGPGLARSLRPRLRPAALASTPRVAAPVAAAPEVTEIDPESLPTGTRLVQIGAFDGPDTARTEWARLTARFGDYLDGKDRVIQKAESGGRTFYRLRAHGFEDLSDARRFCAAFVAQNVDCIPVVTR